MGLIRKAAQQGAKRSAAIRKKLGNQTADSMSSLWVAAGRPVRRTLAIHHKLRYKLIEQEDSLGVRCTTTRAKRLP